MKIVTHYSNYDGHSLCAHSKHNAVSLVTMQKSDVTCKRCKKLMKDNSLSENEPDGMC